MEQKLQEISERLDRIEQTVNLIFGAEKGREQMRAGDYAEDPFVNNNWGANFEKGCMCGTSARCYLHYPHGSMIHDDISTISGFVSMYNQNNFSMSVSEDETIDNRIN